MYYLVIEIKLQVLFCRIRPTQVDKFYCIVYKKHKKGIKYLIGDGKNKGQ